MVKKIKPDGSKTIYPSASLRVGSGGLYEVDKTSSGTITRTVTYYPAGGAMRINIVGGTNTLYYILKDHLGSASMVTNASEPPSVLRTSPPNPQWKIKIIIQNISCVFGGELLESRDGESLEGVDDERRDCH